MAMRTRSRSFGGWCWPGTVPGNGVIEGTALRYLRPARRTRREAISPKVLSVEFTARAVGNIRATSGSRTTTLLPAAYRWACLPRTPPVKAYSARIVSLSFVLLAFFMFLTFGPRRGDVLDKSAERVL